MQIIYSIFLGLIQGLTEFLPISSSGHLALIQSLFSNSGNSFIVNPSFDVLLHLASLIAIIVYFFKDIISLIKGFFSFKWENENFRMCIYIIIATIPAALIGYFLRNFIYGSFSNLYVIAFGFAISGLFLLTASLNFLNNEKKEKEISLGKSFIVGIAQAFALIPGISRSGATSCSSVLLGIERKQAIRFSFLMAIPVILGANFLNFSDIKLISSTQVVPFIAGFIASFLISLFAINLFLKKITLKNFKWLAIYCFVLALITLMIIFI